jgi:midasin
MKIQPLSQIINDHAYNDWKSSAVVSDELFFKGNFMLESIMMYREDAISKDLSRIEIQRCKTMLSHLYSIMGDQRAIFSQILESYFDLLHPLKKNWHSDDLFSKRNIASDCIEVLRVLNIKDQSEITLKNLFKTPAESIDLDNLSIFKQFFKKLNFALNEVQVQDIQELPDVLIDKLELLVKVVVQNILKAFESISNLSEKWIFDLHQMIIHLPSMLKISGIISLAQKNNLKCNENEELLSTYGYCSKQIISSLFTFHVELCKLNVVLHAVIKNLFKEGFCRPKDESEADAENDDQTFDGTGMGEGEGEKDVSKEIEDEEQMQGLQGEEKHQSESGPQYQEDAFDMENDFDGDLMDMKLDNEDNSEDDNEKEDGTDMDKEMGDTGENSEQIDEKLWNDEDEEDEDADNPEDGKEKKEGYNENASKAEENELDLVAKPNFEDSNEKEKKEEDSNIPDDPTDDNEELNEQLKDLADQNDENEAFPEKREKDDLHESDAPEDIQEREPEDNGDSDVEVDEENQMSREDNNSEEDVEDPATTDNAEDAENSENNNFDNDEPEPDIPESSNVDGNPAGHDEEAKENDEDTPEKDDDMGVDSSMNQVDGSADIQNQTNNSELGLENAAESELKDQSMSDIQKDMQNDQKSKDSVTAAQSESPEASENILPGSNSVQDSNEQSSSDTSQSSSESAQSFGDAMKTWFSRLEVLDNQQKNQERKSDIIEDDDQEFDGHRPELAEHVGENERADAQVMLPKNSDENEPIAYPKIDEIKEESAEDILENADPDPEKDALEEIRKADSSSNSSEPKTENTANSHDKKNSQLEKDKSKIKHESDSKPDQGPSVSLPSSMPSHSILKETPAVIDTEEMDETIKSHLEFLNSLEEDSRKDFKSFVDEYIGSDEFEKGMQLWKSLEVETADSSHQLCEQLRIILEPTQMSKMQGDFKTGKRLNMRKIIPYIASEFRKDKIWMRRTKPNKRNYQVVVAIDNSRSMLEVGAGRIALSALALLWSALNKLEAGQVSVISFGDEIRLLHDLNSNFDTSKGAYIASQFEFQDNHTQWTQLATTLVSLFEKSKQHSSDSSKFLQLAFVISDARIQEDKSLIQQWVREASVRKQFLVVIIVDNPDPRQTILNLKSVSYDANRSLKITKYLDEFPFPYYVIVRDISSMPFILSDALRQWFEMIRSCE